MRAELVRELEAAAVARAQKDFGRAERPSREENQWRTDGLLVAVALVAVVDFVAARDLLDVSHFGERRERDALRRVGEQLGVEGLVERVARGGQAAQDAAT